MESEFLSRGQVVADRYVLSREVGRGASGSVWTAEDLQLRRQVALKLLHAEHLDQPLAREAFEAEAQTIAQLRSHNVVQVFDFGIDGSRPFIVMELLEGEGLDARLARHGRLSLSVVANVVHELAQGLSRLHAKRIVHRDVKPANVFLCREPHGDVAKLLDFGVCGRYDAANDESAAPPGTPRYMSPEHISGHRVDAGADCWSLAVVAYEMLCGKCPFDGETLLALRRSVIAACHTPPSAHAPGLAEQVDALFARAFAPERTQRLTDALELAVELRRLVREYGDPVARILFVDDEPDFEVLLRQRFRHHLRRGTHELYFARNGESGLEELRNRPDIDVVFTDLNMPGMNGLAFLAKVPEINPLVRVVVLSAYGDMANIRAAMNRGAFDFICKPIDFNDLELTANRCVTDAAELRRSFANREENGIVRQLLGQSGIERIVSATRGGVPRTEEVDAAILAALFGALPVTEADQSSLVLTEQLAARMSLVQSEVSAAQGLVAEIGAESALIVFRGKDSLQRAVDTALALRDHFCGIRGPAGAFEFRAGIDMGSTLCGSVPLRGSGRVEYLAFGAAVTRARLLRDRAGERAVLVSAALGGPWTANYRHRVGVGVGVDARSLDAIQIEARRSARGELDGAEADSQLGGTHSIL